MRTALIHDQGGPDCMVRLPSALFLQAEAMGVAKVEAMISLQTAEGERVFIAVLESRARSPLTRLETHRGCFVCSRTSTWQFAAGKP